MFQNFNKKINDTFDNDSSIHNGVPKHFYDISNKIFNNWEIPPWELIIYKDKLLGKGSFASVYLAKWRETYVVAKVFNEFCLEEKNFLIHREIDIMTKLHHPNIVQILGYVNDPFIIVMEYIPRGDLLKNLNKLYKSTKIKIMRDCLQALAYYHNRKPESLIHRDIKLSNILLTNSKVAKITDFGLSKLTKTLNCNLSNFNLSNTNLEINDLTKSVGTERYKAPEMPCNYYTNKIDIYALGIVFYELFESKRYNPNNGFKWFWTPYNIKYIIKNYMICKNPNDRLNAIQLIKKFNIYY